MGYLKSLNFWIVILVIILAGFGGYMAGRLTSVQQRSVPKQIGNTNTIFTTQSASIRGYITDVSENKLKVQNISGVSGDVEVSEKVIIKKPESKIATSTADLKQIETRREAVIALELTGGVYRVVTINYIPKPPVNLR